MGRLTYADGKGSWGLKGVDWKTLVSLPPQVYGALAKLKDMENQIDTINNSVSDKDGSVELAMEHLMSMGSKATEAGQGRGRAWILNRFCSKV